MTSRSKGSFFVADRFATDQLLKDMVLVIITAVRCYKVYCALRSE